MASDAKNTIPPDIKQVISPSIPNGEGIVPPSTARQGFFAQVSGNPFFTAVRPDKSV